MRIIGGSARGVRLSAPKGVSTRPTPDMVREALFNILAGAVPGAAFFDVFAGTGAVGLEALSRGAKFCLFSDKSKDCRDIILSNAAKTRLSGGARVLPCDAAGAVALCCKEGLKFDIIYLDPPYGLGLEYAVLEAAARNGLMSDGGVAVLEKDAKTALGPVAGFAAYGVRRYGGTELVFMKTTDEDY